MSQKITVPGMTYPLIQSYSYDELNRLANATETSNFTQTWTQVFGYDRYGNRNITSGTGQTNLTFGGTTNRITTSGYSYDSAGNTAADPSGKSFTYDAENKQTKVTNGGTLGEYWYDGDGKRVKKTTNTSDNIIFIYDAGGRLIEERNSSTGALQTSYIYAGSRLLSTETASATNYLTADHLGSPRINTNGSGNVVARHDYHPFGEEIDGSGGRTVGLGYPSGSDGIRKQFTGYERDNETDLDFAQARMYKPGHGRFTAVDPVKITTERLADPQRVNLYAYARNQPLLYVDPSGEDITVRITNVVVGTQKIRRLDGKKEVREVKSYRMVVRNDSGSQRVFEVTRDSSLGQRNDYRTDREPPPGNFIGNIRRDNDSFNKGFRIELQSPDKPPGVVDSPDQTRDRTNIQIHRNYNDNGTSIGCLLFPQGDRERLEQTITGMQAQDKDNGLGTKINVIIDPRNTRDGTEGSRDLDQSESPDIIHSSFDGFVPDKIKGPKRPIP